MFQKLFGNINKYKYTKGTPQTCKFFINKKGFLRKIVMHVLTAHLLLTVGKK